MDYRESRWFDLRFDQELSTRQNLADTKMKVQQTDERRMREFWLRRKIFDREFLRHREEAPAMRLAWGLACYLQEKEIWFESDLLAGTYGFTEYRRSLPFSYIEPYELYSADLARGLPFDKALIEKSIDMQTACLAKIGSGLHVIGGFERTLWLGMDGIRRELEEGVQKNGMNDFYRSALLCVDAARLYFERVSDAAAMEAVFCKDAGRAQRLTDMARACARAAHLPPRGFQEALQLVALLHEVIQIEERCGSLSFGRLDKYLYPYYQRDVQAGALDAERAQALIDAFWRMLQKNRWGWQNVTLGGYDRRSGLCVNEITYMCLDASTRLRGDQPQLTFRCHPSMPDEVWKKIMALIRTGQGFPALYNDEPAIRAKERVGVSREDAEQYAVLGCVELTIPEKEYSHTEGIRINWPKLLELAVNGGQCLFSGIRFEQKTPRSPESFVSFEDFLAWFKEEFLYYVDLLVRAADEMHTCFGRHYPIPFLSATLYGCAQTGRDATCAGTIYNHSCVNTCGQATMIDSLAAIERFVFQEKRFTLTQLSEMLRSDYAGCEAERRYIRAHCPRFGSDDRCAELMREFTQLYGDFLIHAQNQRGGVREPGFYSVEAQAHYGRETGATPDGRHAGEALSNGTAPTQGTEKYGPTAVFQAVAGLDLSYLSNGMALDMKFHPRFLESAEHQEKFRQAIQTYFDMGGMQVQINVIDRQTLLDAQQRPDDFRDLVVRVSGFSAYFCDLSRAVQDEIIRRTEFSGL